MYKCNSLGGTTSETARINLLSKSNNLMLKKHIHSQFILYQTICTTIRMKPKSGDKRKENGFLCFSRCFKNADFIPQFFCIPFVNFEGIDRKFHFTEIDNLVAAVDNEVNLCFLAVRFTYPCRRACLYATDAQCLFDLVEVH